MGHSEDIANSCGVVPHGSTCGDANVVHIDANGGAKGFVFKDDIAIDVVHHCLEGSWGVRKSKVHNSWFE